MTVSVKINWVWGVTQTREFDHEFHADHFLDQNEYDIISHAIYRSAERVEVIEIINSKEYDLKTADCVGDWDNGLMKSDNAWCHRYLYKKKSGEFFEYGEGNANSAFSKSLGEDQKRWAAGETITPLRIDEAKAWVKLYDKREYETIFGKVQE